MAVPDSNIFTLKQVVSTLHPQMSKHDGSSNVSVLYDSTKNWTTNQWIGRTIYNIFDYSYGLIVSNTSNTITSREFSFNILGVEDTQCDITGYSDLGGTPNTLEFEHNGAYLNSILEVGDEVELNAPGYDASPKVITAVGSFTFQFEEADGGDPTGGQVRVASGGYQSIFENDSITINDGDSLVIEDSNSYNGTYTSAARGINSSHFALPVNYSSDETGTAYRDNPLMGGLDNDWDTNDYYNIIGESSIGDLKDCFDVAVNSKFDSDYGGDSYTGEGTGWDRLYNFRNYGGSGAGTVTDIEGNVYDTVSFTEDGVTYEVMADNLNTRKYSNGDDINWVIDQSTWNSTTYGAYCIYGNPFDFGAVSTIRGGYGLLYNWNALLDSRGLAPTGWHIMNSEEWEALNQHYGGSTDSGGHMKEAGTTYWTTPNTGADNTSSFTARPGGQRDNAGFKEVGTRGYFWRGIGENGSEYGYISHLDYNSNDYTATVDYKYKGCSVRCCKDR